MKEWRELSCGCAPGIRHSGQSAEGAPGGAIYRGARGDAHAHQTYIKFTWWCKTLHNNTIKFAWISFYFFLSHTFGGEKYGTIVQGRVNTNENKLFTCARFAHDCAHLHSGTIFGFFAHDSDKWNNMLLCVPTVCYIAHLSATVRFSRKTPT